MRTSQSLVPKSLKTEAEADLKPSTLGWSQLRIINEFSRELVHKLQRLVFVLTPISLALSLGRVEAYLLRVLCLENLHRKSNDLWKQQDAFVSSSNCLIELYARRRANSRHLITTNVSARVFYDSSGKCLLLFSHLSLSRSLLLNWMGQLLCLRLGETKQMRAAEDNETRESII